MTAVLAGARPITEPGVYDDLRAETYHADPVPGGSLSSTGARKLLPPSCPALYRHWADNRQPANPDFDFGHAAHLLVLGDGPPLVVVDADDWRTKAARAARDDAYEAGAVPLLAADHDRVQAMAAALRTHPVASALFRPEAGKPEQSLFWTDPVTGTWRRARLDWLPEPSAGRTVLADYKTCRSAAPDHLQRAIHDYGYHQQAGFYLDGAVALDLAGPDAAFVFVFQEKTAPYLVTVAQVDALALQVGRYLNRQALDLYAECSRTGHWPGYSDDVELIPLPRWVEAQYRDEDLW